MKKPHATRLPPAPRHLRADGKDLWKRVVSEYELPTDALLILQMACESWDRACDARRALDENGTVFVDRFKQIKARPEIFIERDSREAVARRLKQLGLDLEPLHAGPGRPPGR